MESVSRSIATIRGRWKCRFLISFRIFTSLSSNAARSFLSKKRTLSAVSWIFFSSVRRRHSKRGFYDNGKSREVKAEGPNAAFCKARRAVRLISRRRYSRRRMFFVKNRAREAAAAGAEAAFLRFL